VPRRLARHLVALAAGERRRVDPDRHRERRLVDRDRRQRRGSSGSASVSPIVTSGMPATAMISPGPGLVRLDPVERLGHVQLGHLRPLDRPVGAAPRDLLAPRIVPCTTRQSARRPT
jgi:hypothetical protein